MRSPLGWDFPFKVSYRRGGQTHLYSQVFQFFSTCIILHEDRYVIQYPNTVCNSYSPQYGWQPHRNNQDRELLLESGLCQTCKASMGWMVTELLHLWYRATTPMLQSYYTYVTELLHLWYRATTPTFQSSSMERRS